MDAAQPSFYHVTDPLQNLSLSITLKRVHGGTRKKASPTEEDGRASPPPPEEEQALRSTTLTCGWQEKIFGPRELALLSPGESERAEQGSPRTPRKTGSAQSTVSDNDYKETVAQMLRDGQDPLDLIKPEQIFTYVDKDGFVPKSAMAPHLATTNYGLDPHANPVGLAKTTLPLRQVGSGVLPQAARAAAKHITRESRTRVMHVMAAVDVDVEELRAGSLAGDSDMIHGGPQSAGGPKFYEKILCTIKLHGDGVGGDETMEVTPGFSTEEPEEDAPSTGAGRTNTAPTTPHRRLFSLVPLTPHFARPSSSVRQQPLPRHALDGGPAPDDVPLRDAHGHGVRVRD
jgi:hypothetical protein